MTKRISVLGSTGSIGKNTLDIIRRAAPGNYQLVALTANRSADLIAEQALEFGAEFVALADTNAAQALNAKLAGSGIETGFGPDAVIEAARRSADFTMAAIIGSAGLEPTLAAVEQGNHVGLANKECLVCAGETFMAAVKASVSYTHLTLPTKA